MIDAYLKQSLCVAWHGQPPFSGAQAAHLDGSKDNNTPENIAWVTCSENNKHKVAHGTFKLNLRKRDAGSAQQAPASV